MEHGEQGERINLLLLLGLTAAYFGLLAYFLYVSQAGEQNYKKPMYGKHFASMYEGSMIGSGALMFAVMGYVIAHAKPDKNVGTQVELNPALIAFKLGEQESDVIVAIEKLCAPDPKSRSKEHGGRRLIRLGEYAYQVVNGAKYRAIRDEEARRAQNRESQARFREKNTLRRGKPMKGEAAYLKSIENGGSGEGILDEANEPRHA